MTFDSVQQCSDLLDYLLSRLAKKGPHTKIKTLKILRHVAERGHESFVRDLRQRTDELRAAQSECYCSAHLVASSRLHFISLVILCPTVGVLSVVCVYCMCALLYVSPFILCALSLLLSEPVCVCLCQEATCGPE